MNQQYRERERGRTRVIAESSPSCPRADAWLAGGMASLAAGVWLLRLDDPFLLTLWGVGFVINGLAASTVGAGKLLRVWE
jgi:hypothetical protein